MFSTNELLQLVFADEDDIYYCEDLTQPNLRQYLWRCLHERARCDAVYFLDADEKSRRFTVRSFGDRKGHDYTPKKGLFGGKANEQAAWIGAQLQRSAVFVCPLEDFCRVALSGDWEKGLREIASLKGRTGFFVLTAPPEAERSAPLLLKSPVFDWLGDSAVTDARQGGPRALYSAIRSGKGDACVFLNEFTTGRLRAVLLRTMLETKDRFLSTEELEQAAAYLRAYLRSPRMQREDPLFPRLSWPEAYLSFRELSLKLSDAGVWNSLLTRSRGTDWLRASQEAAEPPIRRDRSACAGRCIQKLHTVRDSLCRSAEAAEKLDGILCSLMTPQNRPENRQIAAAPEHLLPLLSSIRPEDGESCLRLLTALQQWAERLGTPEDSEQEKHVLTLLEHMQVLVELSDECYRMSQDLERMRGMDITLPTALAMRKQTEQQLAVGRKLCSRYQEMVSSERICLTLSSYNVDFERSVETLEQDVREFHESRESVSADEEPQEEQPKSEPDMDISTSGPIPKSMKNPLAPPH